jgi:tRNA threonylcarbamoyladenosine biosynthesis protein TsaE
VTSIESISNLVPGRAIALPTRRATRRLAQATARQLIQSDLVVMSGDLGAGKTFFVRALARSLGVRDPICSPTFTLVHEYSLPGGEVLLHADFYRLLDGSRESLARTIAELGIRERRTEGAIVVVEWGDEAIGPLGATVSLRVELAMPRSPDRAGRLAMLSGPRAGGVIVV